MAWDDDLSDEQKRAASHFGRHARLLAGPGTGKTRSVTKRVLYLVSEQRVLPLNILALTFTRAATSELRKRLERELGEDSSAPTASTLHSFALRTILGHAAAVQLPQPLRIADDYEERWIIQEDLKRILGLGHITEVRDLIQRLSADWEQLAAEATDWETRFPNPAFLGAWREHRELYGYTLRAELVYQLKLALEQGTIEVDPPLTYVLVDEYQDLNPCDLAVIGHLASGGSELYAAGDDDQSIYGFRYANPEGIRQFNQTYTPSESLGLAECYRCDRRILQLGLYVAQQDPRRIDKTLNPVSNQEGEVHILRFADQAQEASGIARICRWLTHSQNIQPGQILILLRTDWNRQFSNPMRATLEGAGLSVAAVANPLEPLERPEGRHFLCLLRLVANPQDHLAWRTILEVRKNNIGTKAFETLYNLARLQGTRFFEVVDRVSNDPSLVPRGTLIQGDVQDIRQTLASVQTQQIEDFTEFIDGMAEDHIQDEELRVEIMDTFNRVLSTSEIENLDQLLRATFVSLGDVEQETQTEAINIMTMHQAKGLSADAVFVVAAEDEYLPGRAVGGSMDDERRLLYVSLTRARHYLYITHCVQRTGQQMHSGSRSGSPRRSLTRFLSGGPVGSTPGGSYITQL